MMNKKKNNNNYADLVGNAKSVNAQNATNASVEGMSSFLYKSQRVKNVPFSSSKGNLFEYIEAAKFNTDAAAKGVDAKAIVTDAIGQNTNPVDIMLVDSKGNTILEIQAKFTKTFNKDGVENSAATAVHDFTGSRNKGWNQYKGMAKLVRKDPNYNKDGSYLDEAKKISKQLSDKGNVHADVYGEISDTLTDEITHNGATSHGTSYEEIKKAHANPDKYAKNFNAKISKQEIKATAKNMAEANFVIAGISSGISNFVKYNNEELTGFEAIEETGKTAIKGAARGYATGLISGHIRSKAAQTGGVLADSTLSTTVAGGIIDGGVAILSYAKGEINKEELKDELVGTVARCSATVFITKAVEAATSSTVPAIVPMAIYTTATYIFKTTKEIIENANLEIEEYQRLAALYEDSYKQIREQREQLNEYLKKVRDETSKTFTNFLNTFEYDVITNSNYDKAISNITSFAKEFCIELQHVKFDDFKTAIKQKKRFVLG